MVYIMDISTWIMLIVMIVITCILGKESACFKLDKVDVSSPTTHELMVIIAELTKNTDKPRSVNVTSRQIEELTKYDKAKCQDLKVSECVELIKDRIIQIQAESDTRRHRARTRELSDYRICFDGSNLLQYDPATHLCCYGKISPRANKECCSNKLINKKEQFCCNDIVYNRSESLGCCGNSSYNTDTQICCKGNVHDKFEGAKCCNHMIYDKKSQVCCFERNVYNKTEGNRCCGNQLYNSSTHICCGGNILPSYSGTSRKTDLCCGDRSYHAKCSICVDGSIEPIHKDKLCCDGVFVDRLYGNDSACCFHNVMNKVKELCINNEIREMLLGAGEINNGIDSSTPKLLIRNASIQTLSKMIGISVSIVCCLLIILVVVRNKRLRQKVLKMLKCKSKSLHPTYNITEIGLPPTRYLKWDSLKKTPMYPDKNLTSEYVSDSATQTSVDKVSNRRTVFGKNFDFVEHLDRNKTTLQIPNSEVKLTLPSSALQLGDVEVSASTFRSLPDLYRKFNISEDEEIASPTVEYIITGQTALPDHAVVIMPFIGSTDHLKVWKFHSDDGSSSSVDAFEVHRKGKRNEELDLFCTINGNFVYIYTKSFSGFYCTTCKHSRELSLRAYVFGSYKRFLQPLRYEVGIDICIADEIFDLRDYKERMFSNEGTQGKVLKKEKELKLPRDIKDSDKLSVTLTPTDGHYEIWIHKPHQLDKTKPMFEATQSVELLDIAKTCEKCRNIHIDPTKKPFCIEWYMCTKENQYPSYTFQCIIDTEITSDNGIVKDLIVIDELQLRQEDRGPTEEDYQTRCLRGVREYLACVIEPIKKAELLRRLKLYRNIKGEDVEDMFFHAQENYTNKGLLEIIANEMKNMKLYDDIDKLNKNGYLPRTLTQYPRQPVSIEVPPAISTTPEMCPLLSQAADASTHLDPSPNSENIPLNLVEQIRPELSYPVQDQDSLETSTLVAKSIPESSYSANEYPLTEAGPVRREMDSHTVNMLNNDTADDNPVQEEATADNTYLKYV